MQFFIKQNSNIPLIRLKVKGVYEIYNVKFNLIDDKTKNPVLINSEGYVDGDVLCYKLSKRLTSQEKTLKGYFTYTYKNIEKRTEDIEVIIIPSFSHHKICCK